MYWNQLNTLMFKHRQRDRIRLLVTITLQALAAAAASQKSHLLHHSQELFWCDTATAVFAYSYVKFTWHTSYLLSSNQSHFFTGSCTCLNKVTMKTGATLFMLLGFVMVALFSPRDEQNPQMYWNFTTVQN